FSTTNVDFYRPIPRLHFGLLGGWAGGHTTVWNVVAVLLHACASVAAFLLAADLLGRANRRAARYAGLAFALHFIHVEPVVWASGVTSLYVGLFLFLALLWFRRARRSGRARDAILSVLAFAGALMSKETAVVFVPLLVLTTWWWPPVRADGQSSLRRPTFAESVPYAILLAAYFAIVLGIDRGGDASPYRMAIGGHLLKNVAFFLLGGFVPVRMWEIQSLWSGAPGLGAFLAELVRRPHLFLPLLLGAVALVAAWLRGGRDVRGGFLWILAASIPFLALPGSGERFQYVSSLGACLVLGLLAQALLRRKDRIPGGILAARGIVLAGLLGLVAGAVDRQADWVLASRWTKGIVSRWSFFQGLDPDDALVFRGIPDSWRSAWVFRNGFASMVRLYWEGRPYWREGEPPPPGHPPARTMSVALRTDGTIVMAPSRDAKASGSPAGPAPAPPAVSPGAGDRP
ncbi:MAG: hypothetical protein KC591_10525, partial [Gemmatimonadetes bacterium]|nr:hypothetical protein [Gemmatimonadota bacterium]